MARYEYPPEKPEGVAQMPHHEATRSVCGRNVCQPLEADDLRNFQDRNSVSLIAHRDVQSLNEGVPLSFSSLYASRRELNILRKGDCDLMTGPFFAIVTPFQESGEVDFSALIEYIEFLGDCGVKNIVVNGTTAEFASLTLEERMKLLERCRDRFPGTIVNHVGTCCLQDSLRLLEHSKEYADAALALPPFYYAHPCDEGLCAFWEVLLRRSEIPVFLYNFPLHTQARIEPAVLSELARRHENLVGIKDSGGELDVALAYKERAPRLRVLVGKDEWGFEVLNKGLDGSVSGAGNPIPEFLVNVDRAFRDDDKGGSQAWQERLDLWCSFRARTDVLEIPVVKAGIRARLTSFPLHVRPPFVECPSGTATSVTQFMTETLLPRLAPL